MKAYHIPNGPKNLKALFPSLNFDNIDEYYIEVQDFANNVLATSTRSQVTFNCCDNMRIHFLNYLGAIDGVNFTIISNEHETKSDTYQKPRGVLKSAHSIGRFNIKANDIITISNIQYREQDMDWLTELVDSPLAWYQWKGTQGQLDSYIPVVIQDETIVKRKFEERYQYEMILKITLSNEIITLRN